MLDQKNEHIQRFGLNRDGLAGLEEAEALEVDLEIVEAVIPSHRKTSAFHQETVRKHLKAVSTGFDAWS